MFKESYEKLENVVKLNPKFYNAKFAQAEVLFHLNKPQEAIGILQSLPEDLHLSKDFLYLSSINYTALAQLSPSNYNIKMAMEYCDKIKELYPLEYDWEETRDYLQETLKTSERH
jgi:tetratricopeptide (TPR) repeat protein